MAKFVRLSPEERKKQICDAAKKVFLEKGFNRTTMEDIINASEMSKGGVYNYYKNSYDIMSDIMIQGTYYRINIMEEFISNHKDSKDLDIVVELFLDKLFDSNEFKRLYAMFLLEIQHDERLKSVYDKMLNKTAKMTTDYLEEQNISFPFEIFMSEIAVSLYNSMIVGIELLGNKEVFHRYRDELRKIILYYLSDLEKNNKTRE